MEKILSIAAFSTFSYFFYNSGKYIFFDKLSQKYNTAVQIDLSYEKIQYDKIKPKSIFLIGGTSSNEISLGEVVEKKGIKTLTDIKYINNLKLEDNNLKILPGYYFVFDMTSTKHETINNQKLSLKNKWKLMKFNFFKENDIYLVNKSIIKDQRILLMGKFKQNSFKPICLIGSGMVEFEEIIEFFRQKASVRMRQTVYLLLGITILSGSNKFFQNYTKINNN